MDFAALRTQALELLQREGRVAYRVLKLQLQIDDDLLDVLKDDLIYAKRLAVDEAGKILVWVGAPPAAPPDTRPPAEAERQLYTMLLAVMALLQREQRVTYEERLCSFPQNTHTSMGVPVGLSLPQRKIFQHFPLERSVALSRNARGYDPPLHGALSGVLV